VTWNVPIGVFTLVPTGSDLGGRGRVLATEHWSVADGQKTQPLALQMSISPLSFTDHAQRAPLAVLSMQMPTAVLPSTAKAGVGSVTTIAATIAVKVMMMG
jgi:hypothetical protein